MHRGAPHQLRWRIGMADTTRNPSGGSHASFWTMAPGSNSSHGCPPRYDLVWFDRAATFEWLGRPQLGPTIIDLHDLEDVKARSRAQLIRTRLVAQRGTALRFARL